MILKNMSVACPTLSKRRSRNYCGTFFYSDEEKVTGCIARFAVGGTVLPPVLYVVYQRECCPTSKRLHLQMYVHFAEALTLMAIVRKYPGINWAQCRGKASQNIAYCTKLESRVAGTEPCEIGQKPMQGKRTDLIDITEQLNALADPDLLEQNPEYTTTFIRYGRAIREYADRRQPKRSWQCPVTIFWGPTGTGKSYSARKFLKSFPERYSVVHLQGRGTEWWNEYKVGTNVLIDDFHDHQLDVERFKNVIDRYEMEVPYKGGFRNFNPRQIVITSNYDPRFWYQGDEAVFRRCVTEATLHHLTRLDPSIFEEEKEEIDQLDDDCIILDSIPSL